MEDVVVPTQWRTLGVRRPGQEVESASLFLIFSGKFPNWLTQNKFQSFSKVKSKIERKKKVLGFFFHTFSQTCFTRPYELHLTLFPYILRQNTFKDVPNGWSNSLLPGQFQHPLKWCSGDVPSLALP